MKERGFEIVKGYEDQGINLPVRKTSFAAGYDIEAASDVVVPVFTPGVAPVLVPTGIKAYCKDDEYILIANRSSNPKKKGLILANSIGIIDKDYYNNSDNDGHIMLMFYNFGKEDVTIHKGDAIGQAIFQKYYLTFDDHASCERTGGFGSTDQQ